MAGCCEHSTKRFISMKDPAEKFLVLKPKSEDEGVHRTQLLEPGTRTRRTADVRKVTNSAGSWRAALRSCVPHSEG